MLRYHIIKGNVLIISYFIFLVSMVTCFWPKHNKCLKMGSKCQIFASLRTRITIFSDLKCITMLIEIPRNRVSYHVLNFWFLWLHTYFWPNLMKFSKVGSRRQIFVSLLWKDCIKPHKAFDELDLHSMTFKY